MAVQNAKRDLLSRPLDLVYFGYFASHIPITVFADLQSLYPPSIVPQALKDVVAWYSSQYKDPFMSGAAPVWFKSLVFCEALLQLPFFFFACYGLLKDSPSIRLPLLVYGTHVATTVIPCLAELLFNPNTALTLTERYTLCAFYLPYFVIPLTLVIDSYSRVSRALAKNSKTD